MGLCLNVTKNRIKEITLCSVANATVMSLLQSKRKVGMYSFYSTKASQRQFHPHYCFNKTITFTVCPDRKLSTSKGFSVSGKMASNQILGSHLGRNKITSDVSLASGWIDMVESWSLRWNSFREEF